MKDEGSLDSAGPFTIVAFLVVLLVVLSGVMLHAHGHWGQEARPTVAQAPAATH